MKTKDFKDLPEVRAKLQPTLILVRHGETDLNDPSTHGGEQIRGWENVPLNAKGVAQGRQIARTVASFPVQRLYTSDLQRAVQTAQTISADLDKLPIRKTGLLRPWNLGKYQGQLWSKVKQEVLDLETKYHARPVPGGESFDSFKHRWLLALKALLTEATENPSQGFIVAVTHTRNLRVAHAWIAAGCEKEQLDLDVLTEEKHMEPGQGLVLTPRKTWVDNGGWKISPLKGSLGGGKAS